MLDVTSGADVLSDASLDPFRPTLTALTHSTAAPLPSASGLVLAKGLLYAKASGPAAACAEPN